MQCLLWHDIRDSKVEMQPNKCIECVIHKRRRKSYFSHWAPNVAGLTEPNSACSHPQSNHVVDWFDPHLTHLWPTGHTWVPLPNFTSRVAITVAEVEGICWESGKGVAEWKVDVGKDMHVDSWWCGVEVVAAYLPSDLKKSECTDSGTSSCLTMWFPFLKAAASCRTPSITQHSRALRRSSGAKTSGRFWRAIWNHVLSFYLILNNKNTQIIYIVWSV